MPTWLQLRRARILGARVYVHWSVLVVVALLALVSIRSPIYAAVAIASYLGIIVIHEAGHAWVAHRLGYAVDAIHVSFLHGYCTHDMPYNETDHVLIAWGGVAAQLVVAIPILTVATISDRQDFGYAAPAIAFLGYVNVVIALANLAPAQGSTVTSPGESFRCYGRDAPPPALAGGGDRQLTPAPSSTCRA